MKKKYEKGTEKIRREPPVFEFGGEMTFVRFVLLVATYRIVY